MYFKIICFIFDFRRQKIHQLVYIERKMREN